MTRCLGAEGPSFGCTSAFPNPPSPSPSPKNHHWPRLMPPPSRAHCRPPCRKQQTPLLPPLPSPHTLPSLPAPHPHSSCPRALRRWQHAVQSLRAALRHNCRVLCGVSYVCNTVLHRLACDASAPNPKTHFPHAEAARARVHIPGSLNHKP
jgi:hypothetical protein